MSKFLKGLKDYFTLASARDDNGDYNYAVDAVKPVKLGAKIAAYFDLASDFRRADKMAGEIMKLANDEGVAKGHFDSSTLKTGWGYSFTEGDFSISVSGGGKVLLKSSAEFADKVKALPSVASVTALKSTPPAAPAPQAPKP